MHGQSPASPEGGRYLSRVGGGVVALGQTGERHPWISFFFAYQLNRVLSLNRGGNAPTVDDAVFRGLGGLDTSLNQHRTQRKP